MDYMYCGKNLAAFPKYSQAKAMCKKMNSLRIPCKLVNNVVMLHKNATSSEKAIFLKKFFEIR